MKMAVFSFVVCAGAWALAGCTQNTVMATSAVAIIAGRPTDPPPADTKSQIREHELWCYRTLADVECYSKAQDAMPGRLVNVEPQNLRPLSAQEYEYEVAGKRPVVISETPDPPPESFLERKFKAETFFQKAYGYGRDAIDYISSDNASE